MTSPTGDPRQEGDAETRAEGGQAAVWVTIEVAVLKEPTNEADPWIPPSAREVAAFVQSRCSHWETDDGWLVSIARADDAARSVES